MARVDRCRGERRQGHATLTGDTIVALSSGAPPAAIAVLRISGPDALAAAGALAGRLPPPRRAGLRTLRDGKGGVLDQALVLVFPGPATATGEDLVELHCHGGRAVVAAVEAALLARPGTRRAEAGEFTRRALAHGRIDLAQAQGLADLLTAETEAERRWAIEAAGGAVSRQVQGWMARLTTLAAQVEAAIDYGDEGDVADHPAAWADLLRDREGVAAEIATMLAAPPVERWRDGWRVVVAGPPNAGKSTLVNMLAGRDAAIVSPIAGTTRDRIEIAVRRNGIGYLLIDTAGLRDATDDAIERIGIGRAEQAIEQADVLVWVDEGPPPSPDAIRVQTKGDVALTDGDVDVVTRHDRPASVDALWDHIEAGVRGRVETTTIPLHARQREACRLALDALQMPVADEVLLADTLRQARHALATILGVAATEALLDELFSAFCVGK